MGPARDRKAVKNVYDAINVIPGVKRELPRLGRQKSADAWWREEQVQHKKAPQAWISSLGSRHGRRA